MLDVGCASFPKGTWNRRRGTAAAERGNGYAKASRFTICWLLPGEYSSPWHPGRVELSMTLSPDCPSQVLQLIQERHNICKQLHLPAQSGSTRVLEAMRRG